MADREQLVPDARLERVWNRLIIRHPALADAVPDTWIQEEQHKVLPDGTPQVIEPLAVFAISEANPRYAGFLQTSVVTMPFDNPTRGDGWRQMEVTVDRYVTRGLDPLEWVLTQAARGHLHTMDELRAMSHPVQRFDGDGKPRKAN